MYQQEQWYKDLPQYQPLFSYRDKRRLVLYRKGGIYRTKYWVLKRCGELKRKKRHFSKLLLRLNEI
jgi:hypothetical protein